MTESRESLTLQLRLCRKHHGWFAICIRPPSTSHAVIVQDKYAYTAAPTTSHAYVGVLPLLGGIKIIHQKHIENIIPWDATLTELPIQAATTEQSINTTKTTGTPCSPDISSAIARTRPGSKSTSKLWDSSMAYSIQRLAYEEPPGPLRSYAPALDIRVRCVFWVRTAWWLC